MNPIEKITIKGFKAFPEEFELNLDGKHLLMYGENGSGKSSIYFALHCLFQSQLKPDKGAKYFLPANPQNIINKHKLAIANQSFVEVNFKDQAAYYRISDAGFDSNAPEHNNLVKIFNNKVVFINHKFIFNFSNHRNSEEINLFPIFVKDILPFTLNEAKTKYLEELYLEILKVSPHPKSTASYNLFVQKIVAFNQEIDTLLGKINLNVSKLYNSFFKEGTDLNLQIVLKHEGENRLSYKYIEREDIVEGSLVKKRTTLRDFNQPKISVEIREIIDGIPSEDRIEKPHVYFNEAKLTAIALSIRFATLDIVSAPDGRFLALDDMLISLDMNNRSKVIDFLLGKSDKYMIYLFTHDRGFFEIIKRKINNQHEIAGTKPSDFWNFFEIYENEDSTNNPIKKKSETFYSQALNQFNQHDYPAAANYLRKAVEEQIQKFPEKINRANNGTLLERLRNCLDNAINLIKKMDNDIQDLQDLRDSLDLLLNPLSHRNQDYDIYKSDLQKVFDIIPRIETHIKELAINEVIARDNCVYMYFNESEIVVQKYQIKLKEELYSFNNGNVRKYIVVEGRSEQSLTITNGMVGPWEKNMHYKGTLEVICQKVHSFNGETYLNNYIDFYQDKDGNQLMTLI
jgi:hypothetical protein